MKLHAIHSNRYAIVHDGARSSIPRIKRELLTGQGACGNFVTIDTRLPAANKTSFKVYESGRRLLVAVCLQDVALGVAGRPEEVKDEVEILFSPYDDDIGYYQFVFTPEDPVAVIHHVPYEFAHSTAYQHMTVGKSRWDLPAWATNRDDAKSRPPNLDEPAWLFAWFRIDDVFRKGGRVGFNVVRQRRSPWELTSWNLCSGHGAQDATGLGKLYRSGPREWAVDVSAECTDEELVLQGRSPGATRTALRLIDPCGDEVPAKLTHRSGTWTLRAAVPASACGRFRIVPAASGSALEPRYLGIDFPGRGVAPPFRVTMTYDAPMDVGGAPVAYTPKALGAELDLYRDHGINRIHWIDVPPEKMYRSAGRAGTSLRARTARNCGDLLPLAASLAKERGMEFFGIFKPFDIAIDATRWGAKDSPVPPQEAISNLEGIRMWALPAIREHQDCTMQVHPEWHPAVTASARRFRIYSRDRFEPFERRDLRLWTSADNRRYTPYRGRWELRQGRLRRAHQRWTPAGNMPEKTAATNWYLEVDGLKLKAPYFAIEFRKGSTLKQRAHAFMEAWDADGAPVPVTIATAGSLSTGFSYWQEWQSWANKSPRMLEDVAWGAGAHGCVFRLRRNRPTLLDMTFETTREVWLHFVHRILETEADGVCIRTLCHHNNVMDHMLMAFAEPVRQAFRERYGREPQPTWEDCMRIREIRGEAYTRFLRSAGDLARKAGKKLAVHLEAGFEIPAEFDQRMQFNMEWETWFREGIADELVLKWWTSQNPFIHERVLPLARRHGVPVHVVDRNSSLTRSVRAVERAKGLLRDAAEAGFAGYAWYESANYKRRNRENVPRFVGHAGDAIRCSAEAAGT